VVQLTRWTANNLAGIGALDVITANYDSAQTHLERALQLYRETGNHIGEAAVIAYLGENAYRYPEKFFPTL
jgi:hypothetical protein